MSLTLNFSSSQLGLVKTANNLVSSVVNQAIVRPIGAPNLTGISGLVLDILDDEEVALDSDITDHYVEQNFSVQDHIALKPVRFTLKGYVGELVDDVPNALASIFSKVTGLATLGGLAPQFNPQDSQVYAKINNAIQLSTNVINQAKNIFQIFNQASTTTNKQQAVYQYLYNMWRTRQLCTVETPFAIFENMAIDSVKALQTGETNVISEFVISFKQITIVSSVVLSGNIGASTSQNTGTISTTPPQKGGIFQQATAAPVSLGSDPGNANSPTGKPISVANTSQSTYLQQMQLPNSY